MFKIIKESFHIVNENIIIATPLIFFSIISSLYLIFSSGESKIGTIFSVILFFLMLCAFFAGWFMMITKIIKKAEDNESKLIAEFSAGVGEYFVSMLGMTFTMMLISVMIIISAIIAGKHFIGSIGVTYAQIMQAASNIDTMKAFVDSLTTEQLVKINYWNILLFVSMLINSFIVMFYPAAIFFKEKNPFKSFFISLKDIFGHRFFKNVALYIIIFTLYMFISFAAAIWGKNIFVHFIITLVNFYYMTFVVILIFNYYYSNFAKIGSNIDATV